MPFHMGTTEIIIILVIAMMIFGVGKLPQVSSSIGKAMREFRQALSGDETESSPSDNGSSKS